MKRELKMAGAVSLLVLGAFTANVWADSGRNKTGAALTYLLNGSPVYKGTVANSDAGFTDNSGTATTFSLDNTAFILAQCDSTALLAQRSANNVDGGTTAARALRLETDEKFLVGLLQPSDPKVSFRAWDAGVVNCKVFEVK